MFFLKLRLFKVDLLDYIELDDAHNVVSAINMNCEHCFLMWINIALGSLIKLDTEWNRLSLT